MSLPNNIFELTVKYNAINSFLVTARPCQPLANVQDYVPQKARENQEYNLPQ